MQILCASLILFLLAVFQLVVIALPVDQASKTPPRRSTPEERIAFYEHKFETLFSGKFSVEHLSPKNKAAALCASAKSFNQRLYDTIVSQLEPSEATEKIKVLGLAQAITDEYITDEHARSSTEMVKRILLSMKLDPRNDPLYNNLERFAPSWYKEAFQTTENLWGRLPVLLDLARTDAQYDIGRAQEQIKLHHTALENAKKELQRVKALEIQEAKTAQEIMINPTMSSPIIATPAPASDEKFPRESLDEAIRKNDIDSVRRFVREQPRQVQLETLLKAIQLKKYKIVKFLRQMNIRRRELILLLIKQRRWRDCASVLANSVVRPF